MKEIVQNKNNFDDQERTLMDNELENGVKAGSSDG